MKKHVLFTLLLAGIGPALPARAQALFQLIRAGVNVGIATATASKVPGVAPAAAVVPTVSSAALATATFRQLTLQRTPAGQLPNRGAEAITALEAQLERCHQTYLADTIAVICSPAQRTALQQTSLRIVQANSGWDLQGYQHEASFYIGEDTRRQLVSAGVRVVVPVSASTKQASAAVLPPVPAAPVASAAQVVAKFQQLKRQRTPTEQLPLRGAEPITTIETELERCHAALLADTTGVICSPAQRLVLQQAAARLVQANSSWNVLPYQREAAFYLDEDARRHLVSTGVHVRMQVSKVAPTASVATAAVVGPPPAWIDATFRQLKLQRTTSTLLPTHGAEQITALETELERCHQALLADPTGTVCSPAQRVALQQASVRVAQANPSWRMQAYQQEASYYLSEDARRQQAAGSAK